MGRQGAGCYSDPALGLEAGAEARTCCPQRCCATQTIRLAANILPSSRRLSKVENLGQVAEWSKAAARKSGYTTQVVSEVRILPLSAKLIDCPNAQTGVKFLENESLVSHGV
jgi:hypothetical protein